MNSKIQPSYPSVRFTMNVNVSMDSGQDPSLSSSLRSVSADLISFLFFLTFLQESNFTENYRWFLSNQFTRDVSEEVFSQEIQRSSPGE